MRGVEVVVVAVRVLGDDDVGRRYVVVDCGIGELFVYACRRVPRFGRGVVGHEDVDGPRIVGREVQIWWGWMNGASPEVCESWVVACRRFFDDGRCPLGWRPNLLGHGGPGRCQAGLLVVVGPLLVPGGATIECSPSACYPGGCARGPGGWRWRS